jgi:hypothetical protein
MQDAGKTNKYTITYNMPPNENHLEKCTNIFRLSWT